MDPGAVALSSLNGTNGFRLDGAAANDDLGNVAASAGDVNGDGFADILVSAGGARPNGTFAAGASYVIFGKASGWTSTLKVANLNGTNGFRLDGVAATDYSSSAAAPAGDVSGDGFSDIIIGARWLSRTAASTPGRAT
ncbi:MAG: integrin alpha [Acetobacteraceae bacterium]|nr:integrin alpha [Acetobacteraceae bacterium]